MTNKNNKATDKKVIEATLTALLGTPYSINKVADLVGMNEGRIINMDTFGISTYRINCEVEETTITDDNFTLTEGRYVDDHEHETMYHYVYLESTSGDWRFRLDVDAAGNLARVKEICTIDHAIEIFKEEVIGKKYDALKTMDKFSEIVKKHDAEEKGETEIQSVEGNYEKYNAEGFYVPVLNSTTVCVAYDEDYNIVEVTAMKSND